MGPVDVSDRIQAQKIAVYRAHPVVCCAERRYDAVLVLMCHTYVHTTVAATATTKQQ